MLRRIGILLLVLTALTPCALAHQDFIQRPTKVSQEPSRTTVFFTVLLSDARVVFQHDEAGAVSAATVYLWEGPHHVPADVCAKLQKVQAETVVFFWSPSRSDRFGRHQESYFGIRFNAGSESERAFGELPEITFIFRSGVFDDAWIQRRTSEKTWQLESLKDGRPLGSIGRIK